MQNWNQWQLPTGAITTSMPQPPVGYNAPGADPMAMMQAYMQYYNQPILFTFFRHLVDIRLNNGLLLNNKIGHNGNSGNNNISNGRRNTEKSTKRLSSRCHRKI